MIQFDQVTRSYGDKVAVEGLSLEVPVGELFAFLGPNGAGKTTTIKLLVGLLRPSRGTVRVCGIDVAARPREVAQHLGLVPDEPYLYDKLTGRELLQFVGRLHGLHGTALAEAIDRQCATFALAEFLDELTETYSHGMKQRLVFASALLHDPPVLVVDEPMVGLDPKSVRLVKDLLRQRADRGHAVFMSTHTLAVAEEIADRIGIVDRGRMRFLGTQADLRATLSSHEASLEQLFLELTDRADIASGSGA